MHFYVACLCLIKFTSLFHLFLRNTLTHINRLRKYMHFPKMLLQQRWTSQFASRLALMGLKTYTLRENDKTFVIIQTIIAKSNIRRKISALSFRFNRVYQSINFPNRIASFDNLWLFT